MIDFVLTVFFLYINLLYILSEKLLSRLHRKKIISKKHLSIKELIYIYIYAKEKLVSKHDYICQQSCIQNADGIENLFSRTS